MPGILIYKRCKFDEKAATIPEISNFS